MVKNLPQCRRPELDPWVGKIPWRRAWQHTPVFLPGEFHGHRSLMSYSPWGRKELDTTEPLTFTLSSLSYFLGALYDVYHHIWCIPSCANHSIKSRFDSYKQYAHTHTHISAHIHTVYDTNTPALIEQSAVDSPTGERQDRGNLYLKATWLLPLWRNRITKSKTGNHLSSL